METILTLLSIIFIIYAVVRLIKYIKNPKLIKEDHDRSVKEFKNSMAELKEKNKRKAKEKSETKTTLKEKSILIKIKNDFEYKSPKEALVQVKVILAIDDIKSTINEEKREGIDTNSSEFYKHLTKDIEDYIFEVEIDNIENFIDNKSFATVEKYGILKGYGIELIDIFEEVKEEKYLTEYDFEDKLFKVLKELNCTDTIEKNSEMEKYFIEARYKIPDLKKLLSSKNIKVSGNKSELINRAIEYKLIKIPNALKLKEDKFTELIGEIVKIYANDLNIQVKSINDKLKPIIKDWAISENHTFKNDLKECLK